LPYLLDTTAVSEYRKPRPNAAFVGWSETNASEETFLGTPTIGELICGVYNLAPSLARRRLQKWVEQIKKRFESRILPFDGEAARLWGAATGNAQRRGKTLSPVDSQLAAIAVLHGLTVITRNVHHFDIDEFQGLKVISPWS
jgi:predicted nucleic acid-binding protein